MSSTSDYRGNRFEFAAARQFGHDFGGLSVECVEVGTKARSSLDLATEDMAGETFAPITVSNLNDLAIAFVTRAELFFEKRFAAKSAELTPEDTHAMVARAEQAKKDQAAAEAATAKADDDRKATQTAIATANAELAETMAKIQAAKAELTAAEATPEAKEESK